jgi:hypothetical protein
MKTSKPWLYIVYTGILLSTLFYTNVSADDLLKLTNFEEGDRPVYGENIVVIQDEQDGAKGIAAVTDSNGKLNIPITLSTGEFEFTLEMYDSGRRLWFFFTLDELSLSFSVQGNIGFTSLAGGTFNPMRPDPWQKDGKNIIRLEVSNGTAKLYVNEIFVKKATLSNDKLNAKYDTLLVTNIDDDHILYRMELTGGVSGSKYAGKVTRDLNMHIPLLNYNSPEGILPLWIEMKFYPNSEGKLLFEVINGGVIPDKR